MSTPANTKKNANRNIASQHMMDMNVSSAGSSSSGSSIRERMNNSKHYTETARLQEAVKLYSTLEETDSNGTNRIGQIAGIQGVDVDGVFAANKGGQSFEREKVIHGTGSASQQQQPYHHKNFFSRLQTIILRRIFQANYVLLENQSVTPLMYHVILLLEFVQMLFFVFHKADILNEFKPQALSASAMTDSLTENSQTNTSTNLNSQFLIDIANSLSTIEDTVTTERADQFFAFINFPLMILKQQSQSTFMIFLITLTAIFYSLFAMAFFLAESFFTATKNGELKEGTRMLIKVYSFFIVLFLTILQIPMLTTYLQGYMCNEDPDDVYVLDIMCEDSNHSTMIAISTVLLIPYLIFIIIQSQLYTSRSIDSMEAPVPWASLNPKVDLIRILLKIIATAGFVFDKYGVYHGYVSLLCAIISGVNIYKRMNGSLLLIESVYYAQLIYDGALVWLFLSAGSQTLGSLYILSVTGVVTQIIVGIFIGILVSLSQFMLKHRGLTMESPLRKNRTPATLELYFIRIMQLIISKELDDKVILNGILSLHLDECTHINTNCTCQNAAEGLDHLHALKAKIRAAYERQGLSSNQSSTFLGKELGQATTTNMLGGSSSSSTLEKLPIISSFLKKDRSSLLNGNEETESLSNSKNHPPIKAVNSAAQKSHKRDAASDEVEEEYKQGEINAVLELDDLYGDAHRQIGGDQGHIKVSKLGTAKYMSAFNKNEFKSHDMNGPPIHKMSALNIISKDKGGFGSEFYNHKMPQSPEGSSCPDNTFDKDATPKSSKDIDQVLKSGKVKSFKKGIQVPDHYNKVQQIYGRTTSDKPLDTEIKEILNEEQEIFISQAKARKIQKLWFKFLSYLIQDSIHDHPKSAELMIMNSQLQRTELKNEFKAIFELMKCELCSPSIIHKFIIFRRKVMIEQSLISFNDKNAQTTGNLDCKMIYSYERHFQHYALLEYVTSNSALGFWRELLQKNIDATAMQRRGQEISSNYQRIQDVAEKLMNIWPNEIKFLYRYGIFLKQIVNNEYEAISNFEKACQIFVSKTSKKAATSPINEQTLFGENTASAIIMISATSQQIGKVIHANEEVRSMLGYNPRELVGNTLSLIMPRPIAVVHDKYIQNYFETAKSSVVNKRAQMFGANYEGYLKIVNLMIKVYPQISDKIVFLGFLQNCDAYDKFEPPSKVEFDLRDQQYIMTDSSGNITNVTEGLNVELGLSAKFFNQSANFHFQINLSLICPDIHEQEVQDQLEIDGQLMTFDTRDILNFIELEQFTSEEILEVRSKLGIYQVFVQLKRINYGEGQNVNNKCTFNIYRVLIVHSEMGVGDTNGTNAHLDMMFKKDNEGGLAISGNTELVGGPEGSDLGMSPYGVGSFESNDDAAIQVSLASVSSGGGFQQNLTTFKKMIKDFKKVLGERKTPGALILLNRVLIMIVLISIALTCSEYVYKGKAIAIYSDGNLQSLNCETRYIQLIQLASNIRSLVDISNGLETNIYEGKDLTQFKRYDYLSTLVQQQSEALQETQDYLTQQRVNELTDDASDSILKTLEQSSVQMYRVDLSNKVYNQSMQFRVALSNYLNTIQLLNQTNVNDLVMPMALLKGSPESNASTGLNSTTSLQKNLMFLLLNGFRSLRERSLEAANQQMALQQNTFITRFFLGIIITGTVITLISTFFVLRVIWLNERNKADILSLYALLRMRDIKKVYDKCDKYLDSLVTDGAMTLLQLEPANGGAAPGGQLNTEEKSKYAPSGGLHQITEESQYQDKGRAKIGRKIGDTAGNRQCQDFGYSQLSEEEKEEAIFKQFMLRKRAQKKDPNRSVNYRSYERFQGHFLYQTMIKNMLRIMKEILERDQTATNKDPLAQTRNQKDNHQDANKKHLKGRQIAQSSYPNSSGGVIIYADDSTERELINQSTSSALDLVQNRNFKKKQTKIQKQLFKGSIGSEDLSSEGGGGNEMQSESDEESSDEPNSNTRQRKHHHNSKKSNDKKGSKDDEVVATTEYDLVAEELEQRKKLFFQSIKNKNWRFLSVNTILGLLFTTYFMFVYFYHTGFEEEIGILKSNSHHFFDRYSNLLLSYDFVRERILNNNSLDSFYNPEVASSPQEIDSYYKDMSLRSEQYLTNMKISAPHVLQPVVEFLKTSDSNMFCQQIIGEHQAVIEEKIIVTRNLDKKLKEIRKKAYQIEIQTVIAACNAASENKLDELKRLHELGVDLNQGDYDKRTPLHVACAGGHLKIVQYLIDIGMNISPVDRWGATPLCDAQPYPELKKLLESKGAKLGKIQPPYQGVTVTILDDQFRLFYAAFYGDTAMMDNLRLLGWNVNGQDYDGRSAIGIAASEGRLEAVKYLVAKGADMSIKDARGNDPLADATRENRTSTIQYLSGIINESLIRGFCSQFYEGLLKQGIMQAAGTFHKKLSDIQISTMQKNVSQAQFLKLLNPPNLTAQELELNIQYKSINTFLSVQELYIHKVISQLVDVVKSTQESFTRSYGELTKIIFISFMAFQVVIIAFFRNKLISIMREEVFQSRGILNLIPEEFFEENRDQVETLIKKLKD